MEQREATRTGGQVHALRRRSTEQPARPATIGSGENSLCYDCACELAEGRA
jgi:hypothetical protein